MHKGSGPFLRGLFRVHRIWNQIRKKQESVNIQMTLFVKGRIIHVLSVGGFSQLSTEPVLHLLIVS